MISVSLRYHGNSLPAVPPTSPVGVLVSRWIYWKCQTDWHYGRSSLSTPNQLRTVSPRFSAIALCPPWSAWLGQVNQALQPSSSWAHRLAEPSRRLAKNSVVLHLLDWALVCDPTYTRLYLDKSFIEDREVNSPRDSEEILLRGLSQIRDPSQRAALLVELIFLRCYRLGNRTGVWELQRDLSQMVAEAGSNLSPESQRAVRACLSIRP